MADVRKTEVRKPIYDYVEGLLGRVLTVTEHNTLKDLVQVYADHESGYTKELTEAMHRSGRIRKQLARSLYNVSRSKVRALEEIEFLRKWFEDNEPSKA